MYTSIEKLLFLNVFLLLAFSVLAQKTDTVRKQTINFNGALIVTNNGFSLIPAFTLGKPAALATIYASSKRLSFEPELRYSLEGKPWSFIFIWRYKLIKKNKFQFSVGTHFPAINFKSDPVILNGVEQESIRARRFFPVIELIPVCFINKDISMSIYYQYGHALEKELAKNTNFISLRSSFSNIALFKNIYMRFNPQLYYLKMDAKDGFYFASGMALAMRNFPVSISSLMNKAIQTDIAGKKFDWNVSLVYSFNRIFETYKPAVMR